MQLLLKILLLTLIAVGTLISYGLLNIYVLSKFRPNKWIIFTIGMVILFIPFGVTIATGKSYFILQILTTVIFVILALWFIDLMKFSPKKKDKEKKILIKSKAKPNRAKQFKNNQSK